ncbi:MAG: hypothetical protein R3335_03355 [Anaerolineales bacterium]|nr:hypothetical protein [Anaerolineales bacterium]
MTKTQFVDLREIGGVQHCHGENCDEYYYRPLVYGDNLFTYVAHIPPGGGVPPDQEEADMYELSLYILDGTPTVYYGEDQFIMYPHTALHCKRGVKVGFDNPTKDPVSLVLSFTPAPGGPTNSQEMQEFVEARGRSIFSPASMNSMSGGLLNGVPHEL